MCVGGGGAEGGGGGVIGVIAKQYHENLERLTF